MEARREESRNKKPGGRASYNEEGHHGKHENTRSERPHNGSQRYNSIKSRCDTCRYCGKHIMAPVAPYLAWIQPAFLFLCGPRITYRFVRHPHPEHIHNSTPQQPHILQSKAKYGYPPATWVTLKRALPVAAIQTNLLKPAACMTRRRDHDRILPLTDDTQNAESTVVARSAPHLPRSLQPKIPTTSAAPQRRKARGPRKKNRNCTVTWA